MGRLKEFFTDICEMQTLELEMNHLDEVYWAEKDEIDLSPFELPEKELNKYNILMKVNENS